MTGLLVGRDAETKALRARLASPGARPGPVVLVAGEAGAGKTTLVEDALAGTATVALRGRAAGWACSAYEVLASALRPAVRGAAGPVPGALAQIMPELGAPPAAPGPGALAAAVCSILADAAGTAGRAAAPPTGSQAADGRESGTNGGGLALFLDDLQWADEATLSLLPALADAATGLPVAVVGCYRSDELPRGHHLRTVRALLRRNHQLAEIELGPLGDADVARMLTGLLGAPPQPALASVVASRSDGLPFAVEELAFALRTPTGSPTTTARSRWPAWGTRRCRTASVRRCCCGRRGSPMRNGPCSRPRPWRAPSSTWTPSSPSPAWSPGPTASPGRGC